MRTRRYDFLGSEGQRLAARLDAPEFEPVAYALFAHCFTCSKDVLAAGRIAAGLARHGIATVRFDFTGLGGSGGDFANAGFRSNIEDLVAASADMRANLKAPAILIGHSLGGAAVLAAAQAIPEVRAVVTIGAPFDTAHTIGLFADRLAEIEARGEATVSLGGRPFTIRKALVDELKSQDQRARIAGLGRPLLVMHAPEDQVVGFENAEAIVAAAAQPRSLVALDGADHLLSRRADAEFAASMIAAWATRYLDRPATPARIGERRIHVAETSDGRFQQAITMGPHALTADEPAAVGGDDAGPGPYDLLLAALGACTSMTLRLYAERKGWPLGRVRVDLGHRKIHAEDCAECETRVGLLDEITREITLPGPLDAEQRARLIEIADKCPVHRTLTSEVRILTAEVPGDPA